ncbi:DUF3459 domain-containing protein, partial [Streptomyces europaeiscabiei]|uniref:DUF3459 domain-containing protein n=1 Tax=Streptomyces europaeiscabiei TaxID=146819 RepID=UPI0029A24D34
MRSRASFQKARQTAWGQHPALRLPRARAPTSSLNRAARSALHTAEANQADRTSMLQLYRSALRLRRTNPDLRGEDFRRLDSPPGTLLFERGNGLLCAVNLTDRPIPLPAA